MLIDRRGKMTQHLELDFGQYAMMPVLATFETYSSTYISRSGDFSMDDDDNRHTDRSHNHLHAW